MSMIQVQVPVKLHNDTPTSDTDWIVEEEPLEIQINGHTFATIMRTPGEDENLIRGFLFTESIASSNDDILSIRHCQIVDGTNKEENIIQVKLASYTPLQKSQTKREIFINTSCGVCGKKSIQKLIENMPKIENNNFKIAHNTIYQLSKSFRKGQTLFDSTGGIHAAALFSKDGELITIKEDAGRHNAVDKVIGSILSTNKDLFKESILFVSGRVSFEIVQKSVRCLIPILIAVSSPTSLAVELANISKLTLIGFMRDNRMNIYTHPSRITLL